MKARSLILLASIACGGCTQTTFSVPKTPNPVLLGPIDRVGGTTANTTPAQAPGEKEIGFIGGQAEDFVSASTSQERHGNYVERKTEVSWRSVTSGPFVAAILEKTEGDDARQVRIRAIKSGAYFFFISGTAISRRWTNVTGDVVEVDHASK